MSDAVTKRGSEEIQAAVREAYGRLASREDGPGCCTPGGKAVAVARRIGYSDAEIDSAPAGANLGVGCGNPLGLVAVSPGSVVLDLGSGAGLDAFLASRAVGPHGRVIGVDMTDAMLTRARANAERAGIGNVEFRKGTIEALPVTDASVDVVISNCVLNLVADKQRAFREAFRVLRPGGRLAVSDLVLLRPLSGPVFASLEAYVGCVAGAALREAYLSAIREAGFESLAVRAESGFADVVPLQTPELLERGIALGVEEDQIADALGAVVSIQVTAEKPAATRIGERTISRDELRLALERREVVLLDAQAPGWYELEHLPDAIKLPDRDLSRRIVDLVADRNAELVVYCWSETCAASGMAAAALRALGYRNVRRYVGGKKDWMEAGLPIVEGAAAARAGRAETST